MLLLRDLMKLISKPEKAFINGEREEMGVGWRIGDFWDFISYLIKLRDSKLLLNALLSGPPLLPPILGGVQACTRPPKHFPPVLISSSPV